MSRTDKVAILLISLGEDLASELLQKLPAAEAKRVLQAISGMKNLDAECIDAVQEEFQSLLVSFKARSPDGGETARRIISKTFDADDAAKFNSTLAPYRHVLKKPKLWMAKHSGKYFKLSTRKLSP